MRKFLLALLACAACADSGGGTMGGGGGGAGSDTGGGGGDGGGGGGSAGGDVSAMDKQQDYDDVAASVGANLSAGDLGAMVDAVNIAYGRNPQGFTLSQGPDYQVLDGMRGGLTVQYRFYCRDAADNLIGCNGAEDHAHVKPTYSGSISGAAASMDGLQRSAAWIVRDLAIAVPRLGGTGTDAFASHLMTGDYQFSVTDTANKILFAPTPVDPSGGSFDLTLEVQRSRASANPADRTFTVAAHLAFTGGDAATITLDSTQNYALTLSTGAVVRM